MTQNLQLHCLGSSPGFLFLIPPSLCHLMCKMGIKYLLQKVNKLAHNKEVFTLGNNPIAVQYFLYYYYYSKGNMIAYVSLVSNVSFFVYSHLFSLILLTFVLPSFSPSFWSSFLPFFLSQIFFLVNTQRGKPTYIAPQLLT